MIFFRRLIFFFFFLGISMKTILALDARFSMLEYQATIRMNFCQLGTLSDTMACKPADWQRIYRSPVVGMDNRFDVWIRETDGLVGVSMRGTTPRPISWMENFYSAMVPAKGSIKINDSTTFNYCFAERKDASVHLGWTYALGAMHQQLLSTLRNQYEEGSRDFLIFGHSQGGALSYLTFAYFHYLQQAGHLPKDLRFKMVASAGPKVGNIHFAYDFESYTPSCWAYNVINPEDWIPLMPISVQTTKDMTTTQPFTFIKQGLKSLKPVPRIAIRFAYKSMNRRLQKASKSLQKNLGNRVGKQIKKERPQFEQPSFHYSMNYVRAGNHIILETNPEYYQRFPQKSEDIFVHHMLAPYLFLSDLNLHKFNE